MRGISSMAVLLASAVLDTAAAAPSCAKGLYIVVARGSDELPGAGVSANLTNQVAEAIPNSVVAPVDYPATLLDYTVSETKGVRAMHALLDDYHQACPDSKMAIFGYSQGAHVGMDTVCGGIGPPYDADAAVSSAVLDNVVAVALYGDPTHRANLTYDRGTSTRNGIFPRNNTAPCLKLASKIVSYCDSGDIYCDSGNNVSVHHQYITKYGSDIVSFVVDQFESAGSASSGPNKTVATGTAAPTTSAVSTSRPSASHPNHAAAMGPSNGLFASAVVLALSSMLFHTML